MGYVKGLHSEGEFTNTKRSRYSGEDVFQAGSIRYWHELRESNCASIFVTVAWYHDTVTKNLTIRIPDDLAANAEAIARVDGVSLNETVKQSLVEAIERRRQNPEFKARLKKIIEDDRELLERLAK